MTDELDIIERCLSCNKSIQQLCGYYGLRLEDFQQYMIYTDTGWYCHKYCLKDKTMRSMSLIPKYYR